METTLLGLYLTQYDAIKETFREMKPFLNINEETGRFYYRLILILKLHFVVYAFARTVKPLFLILKYVGNFSDMGYNPAWRTLLNILSVLVIFLLYKKPLALTTGEFLIDIFTLLVISLYVIGAYLKELYKMSSIIFLCLFVLWSINDLANTGQFRLSTYFQIFSLLTLAYFPLMSNNSEHRHRLNFMYIIMYIWVLCTLFQHYDKSRNVMHLNNIKEAGLEELQTKQSSKLDDTLYSLDINDQNMAESVATNEANEASGKENYQTEASSDDVSGNKITKDKVTDHEFGNLEDHYMKSKSSKDDKIHERSRSNDIYKPEGNKILNVKKPLQVFNKRLGDKAAVDTEKGNKLGIKLKSTNTAIQVRTYFKSKFQGNALQISAGKNFINVPKIKGVRLRSMNKDGTELQLKRPGALKGRIKLNLPNKKL